MKNFFIPQEKFPNDEWILRYKVMSLLIMAFIIGIYILGFSIYRISQGSYILGIVEFIFSLFLLVAFLSLRVNKARYILFAKIFFVFVYVLLILHFLTIPENATRFHWVPTTLVLIFFLLDTKGGLLFLVLYLLFIFYLIWVEYPYSTLEYITWTTSLAALALVMYFYEKIKENEKISFLNYTAKLQEEVEKKTEKLAMQNIQLQELNEKLEERVHEELSKQIEQEKMLLRQCRMANMGEMIDAIAHQWRQPLMNINAVLMNLDIYVENKTQDKVLIEESVREIASLTSHMSQTIEDFRTLYQIEKDKHVFSLVQLMKDVLTIMKNNLQNIQIDMKYESDIEINSYKSELTQVIITFIANAIEALKARNINEKSIMIDISEDEQMVYMGILDNAGGIKESEIDKIFDPYFTTKKQTGGTGLGLYIAKIIIEHNMHGKIIATNNANGAKFLIILPKD